jgi:hypothetical protein
MQGHRKKLCLQSCLEVTRVFEVHARSVDTQDDSSEASDGNEHVTGN